MDVEEENWFVCLYWGISGVIFEWLHIVSFLFIVRERITLQYYLIYHLLETLHFGDEVWISIRSVEYLSSYCRFASQLGVSNHLLNPNSNNIDVQLPFTLPISLIISICVRYTSKILYVLRFPIDFKTHNFNVTKSYLTSSQLILPA